MQILNYFILFPIPKIVINSIVLVLSILFFYYQNKLFLFIFLFILVYFVYLTKYIKISPNTDPTQYIETKRKKIKDLYILLFCFSLGLIRCYFIEKNYKEILNVLSEKSIVQAEVIDITNNRSNFKYSITLKIKKINNLNVSPFYLKINALKMPHSKMANLEMSHLEMADLIEIDNLPIVKLHVFDSIKLKEKIIKSFYIKELNFKIINHQNNSFRKFLKEKQNFLENNLKKNLSEKAYALYCYIFLGKKPENIILSQNIKNNFNNWGITHYLARSGLHVVLIILIWSYLLTLLVRNFYLHNFLILFFLIIYSLLTYNSVSFTRALLFGMFYQISLINRLPINYLHMSAFIFFILLLINPFYLFALDFQLTFLLSFGLSWINELKYFQYIKEKIYPKNY